MQNIDRWRSNQFQPTHIWNAWSNKTDANLEYSACAEPEEEIKIIKQLSSVFKFQNIPLFVYKLQSSMIQEIILI